MKQLVTFITLLLISFALSSQTVSTLIGPNIGINDGLVLDSEGNLYGTNHGGYEVYKYDLNGELTTIATFANHPNAITVDGEDNLYVSVPQGDKIFKITPMGEVEQYGPTVPNPNGLIFDKDSGTLIVTSYLHNTISKLSPDGNLSIWIDSDDLNGPLGLLYDENDDLYVSNFNDGKMFKIQNSALEYFATIPGAYLGNDYFSTGYITFLDGYIYATGYATHKVYRVNQEGEVFEYAGSGIPGLQNGEAASAQFYYPNGIIASASGDSLYVSGYENHVVRVISELNMQNNWTKISSASLNCYPNPFKETANFSYKLGKPSVIDIRIVDLFGREVCCLKNNELVDAGEHLEIFNPKEYSLHGGIYYFRLIIDEVLEVQKIICQ